MERSWIICTLSDMPCNDAGKALSSSLEKVLSMQLNGIKFIAVFVVTFQLFIFNPKNKPEK